MNKDKIQDAIDYAHSKWEAMLAALRAAGVDMDDDAIRLKVLEWGNACFENGRVGAPLLHG